MYMQNCLTIKRTSKPERRPQRRPMEIPTRPAPVRPITIGDALLRLAEKAMVKQLNELRATPDAVSGRRCGEGRSEHVGDGGGVPAATGHE